MFDVDSITYAVNNIARMQFKPCQKAELIRVYLLPRYIYRLVAAPPSMGTLMGIDGEIRQILQRIFKMH
jgi:hypothetical protein